MNLLLAAALCLGSPESDARAAMALAKADCPCLTHYGNPDCCTCPDRPDCPCPCAAAKEPTLKPGRYWRFPDGTLQYLGPVEGPAGNTVRYGPVVPNYQPPPAFFQSCGPRG